MVPVNGWLPFTSSLQLTLTVATCVPIGAVDGMLGLGGVKLMTRLGGGGALGTNAMSTQ
jgi:hypothetical protein